MIEESFRAAVCRGAAVQAAEPPWTCASADMSAAYFHTAMFFAMAPREDLEMLNEY